MKDITLGYAFCGSFCTIKKSLAALKTLADSGYKIHDIAAAEPIGPKNLLDIIVVSPCTGNTAAKIALGITDTPVTMAVKASLRNNKPAVLAVATNDALGASAKNLGLLHNTSNIYFVPYRQDDPLGKNNSLVCDFSLIPQTVEKALKGEQIQPILI